MSPSRRSTFVLGVLVGVLFGVLLVRLEVLPFTVEKETLSAEAQRVIEESYFRAPSPGELGDASVNGMVGELRKRYDDRFSHYFDPATLRQFEASTSGRFSGVGMAVSEVKRGLRVAQVYPDTPAEGAGIEEGDLILAVDGESIGGVGAKAAAAQIKGRPGTPVTLRVQSGGGRPQELEMRRAEVRIPAVRGEMVRAGGHEVAYVQLATFSEGAHGELRDEIERLDRRGAEALVLDLRGNGGGLLNEGVLAASIFLEEGVVVATEGRTSPRREYRAVGDALPERPTAVLVNRDTASAAEILAAAMADHGLAELVGERTYGKGTFQEVIELENGGALDLTVGEFVTSKGRSLAGRGIKPPVQVRDDGDPEPDEALERALDRLEGRL